MQFQLAGVRLRFAGLLSGPLRVLIKSFSITSRDHVEMLVSNHTHTPQWRVPKLVQILQEVEKSSSTLPWRDRSLYRQAPFPSDFPRVVRSVRPFELAKKCITSEELTA